MLDKVLKTMFSLPRHKVIPVVVGSGVATSTALFAATLKPTIPTMTPEWNAATKDYRRFQKMDDVYCTK